jgi:hypothetical protein
VVSTGTATVSTGMLGRYFATSRAVEPPRVSTTIRLACTCNVLIGLAYTFTSLLVIVLQGFTAFRLQQAAMSAALPYGLSALLKMPETPAASSALASAS